MVVAGNHVATDPGLAQGRGERGGQADRFQGRMHVEGDPRSHIVEGQSGALGLLALDDQTRSWWPPAYSAWPPCWRITRYCWRLPAGVARRSCSGTVPEHHGGYQQVQNPPGGGARQSSSLLRAASSTTPLRSGTTLSTGTAWRQTPAVNLPARWLKPSTLRSVRSTSSRKNSPKL